MERRLLEWLFAPGTGSVMFALFFFSSLGICWLPIADDEKLWAIRGVILPLAVLYFYLARNEALMILLDLLLSMLLSIALFFPSVLVFTCLLQILAEVTMTNGWLGVAAKTASFIYVFAGNRLARMHGGKDTSALKTVWMSYLITPLLAERLIASHEKILLEKWMSKREHG